MLSEFRIKSNSLYQNFVICFSFDIKKINIEKFLSDFHVAHERAYTFRLDGSPIELVNFHLTATAAVPRPKINKISNNKKAKQLYKTYRKVFFSEDGDHETKVLERELLPAGYTDYGPLLVEEKSATTVVHPEQKLFVDEIGSFLFSGYAYCASS